MPPTFLQDFIDGTHSGDFGKKDPGSLIKALTGLFFGIAATGEVKSRRIGHYLLALLKKEYRNLCFDN